MIHDTANIYDTAIIGEGTKVGAFAEIGRNVIIGKDCSVGCGAFIPENVIIKDNVFIGPHVVFTNDKYAPSNGAWRDGAPTVIEDDVSIGANATILPNLTIGRGSNIGAGSVVTKSVKEDSTVLGNPAREISRQRSFGE
jgi:UDP-2-acetamido-3-amino-2,3-dideoxy-glucuronate N-acetyltransferase